MQRTRYVGPNAMWSKKMHFQAKLWFPRPMDVQDVHDHDQSGNGPLRGPHRLMAYKCLSITPLPLVVLRVVSRDRLTREYTIKHCEPSPRGGGPSPGLHVHVCTCTCARARAHVHVRTCTCRRAGLHPGQPLVV